MKIIQKPDGSYLVLSTLQQGQSLRVNEDFGPSYDRIMVNSVEVRLTISQLPLPGGQAVTVPINLFFTKVM